MDCDPSSQEHDVTFDQPPCYRLGRQPIKLQLGGFGTTSLLLVIHKFIEYGLHVRIGSFAGVHCSVDAQQL